MMEQTAEMTVQLDDEDVVVRKWRFMPRAQTGWHRHEHDFIVVPITDGELVLRSDAGECTVTLTAGQCYGRAAGIAHNAVNESEETVVLLEVSLKDK